jgi:hypothetical protein
MKISHSSRKKFGLTILFSMLMFACTLGENKIPQGNLDVSLETSVAMTIAVIQGEDTSKGSDDNLDGNATNPPANTDEAPAEGDTATLTPIAETPVPTDSPTETPTPTMVPTSTTVAGDPKISLGGSDWNDSFDTTTSWYLYDIDNYKADIKDGYFKYLIREPKFFSVWTISYPKLENFYLETTAVTPAACAGKDRYGLFFGAPLAKTDDGYMYEVACDGTFRLGWYDGSESKYELLINWKSDAAITAGANQSHRLGVLRDGNNIKLYINGIKVGDVNDSKFIGERRFGLMVGSDATNDFEIKYDDIQYWKLP